MQVSDAEAVRLSASDRCWRMAPRSAWCPRGPIRLKAEEDRSLGAKIDS